MKSTKLYSSFGWCAWTMLVALYIFFLINLLRVNSVLDEKEYNENIFSLVLKHPDQKLAYENAVEKLFFGTKDDFIKLVAPVNLKEKEEILKGSDYLKTILEKNDLKDANIIGYNIIDGLNEKFFRVVEEVKLKENHFIVLMLGFLKLEGSKEWKINKISWNTYTKSLKEQHAVIWKNITLKQSAVLFAHVFIPILILFSIFLCLKSNLRFKGLWFLILLFGIGEYLFNFSTEQGIINYGRIILLGTGYWKASPYSPLEIQLSLPIGAILFLFTFIKPIKKFFHWSNNQ